MAIDMFLDLGGAVKGESSDKTYKGKIDISSYHWGLSQTGTFHQGTGGGAGKVSVKDIQVEKLVDSASPVLMDYCAQGKHFDKGKIIVRKAGGSSPVEYITIDLTKVLISSVDQMGQHGDEKMRELVTLNFAEVKFTYTPQNDDGSKGGAIDFKRNIQQNSAS